MRISYNIPDSDIELTCQALEDICEGVIEAMVKEIDVAPDDFPCCNHCGEFCLWPAPGFPVDGFTHILAPGRTVHVRNATEIVRGGGGSTIDLACFQAAQRRRRKADPYCGVAIDYDKNGNYTALVQNSDKHENPEKHGLIEPAVEPDQDQCGCGGHGAVTE